MGVVAETGPGVDTAKFPKGQRVTALGWPAHEGNGSWQEYVAINQKQLVSSCVSEPNILIVGS